MTSKISVTIEHDGKEQEIPSSSDGVLLSSVCDAAIDISHSCGGMGTCGTCRIEIISGLEKLASRNDVENEMATDRGFAANERLACQTTVVNGLKIRIP